MSLTPHICRSIATPHGFFTRHGGTSTGLYHSLNCALGTDDNVANVEQNRARITQHFSTKAHPCLTLQQVHSNNCIIVDSPFPNDKRPQADAYVTTVPNIILGILTADCAPILFYDEEARVIGAAHAGWKGAVSGIAEATVKTMESCGASRSNIHAAIGPCISQASYEVDRAFKEHVCSTKSDSHLFFIPSHHRPQTHFQFDLRGFIKNDLSNVNIEHVHSIEIDTYQSQDFFSYRRSTHNNEADFGRHLSAIMLPF